jgi:putative phosphoesterase
MMKGSHRQVNLRYNSWHHASTGGAPSMKIGILSDTHNHFENTRRALAVFREAQPEHIIHCGDFTTSKVMELLVGWSALFVFGNIDHDRADLKAAARYYFCTTIGEYLTLELGDRRIAVCHGDNLGQLGEFIHCGIYDYVLHGHTHRRRDEWVGQTRVINPGALGGRRAESRSVCLLDLSTGEARFEEIPES